MSNSIVLFKWKFEMGDLDIHTFAQIEVVLNYNIWSSWKSDPYQYKILKNTDDCFQLIETFLITLFKNIIIT